MKNNCPFCSISSSRIVSETDLMTLIQDGFPVAKGHLLIIPKRHIISFFDLHSKELQDVLKLLHEAKGLLNSLYQPDGYNIGINDGAAAGQTVQHLHIHIIPRYKGDSPDPRGGIRWVIPEKVKYWK
ncbi:MAG: HIT family protein [Bacteroidota bacterium]|nr:HIT family protein [Bacteroidota bacterium]